MAAVTPDSIVKASWGNYHVYMVKFANTVDTADTWVSGITGVVFWMATQADGNTTQGSAGVGATLSGTTFTLVAGEDNTAIHLAVVATGS